MEIKNLLDTIKIPTKTIVIGVSTGCDSMCLLHYLMNNTKKQIICAHINHNVRKESEIEYQYLKKFCQENKIIFESMKIEKYSEKNFENEARNKRYDFYEKILNKHHTKYLFLAHHGDDLIETIIMKIKRGSNLEGYAGFKEISYNHRYYIIRPLIKYSKLDIMNYCQENNLLYYNDYTNNDLNYERNKIRAKILPVLKENNENIHLNFIKYSNKLNEYQNYIQHLVNINIKKVYADNSLNIQKFMKIDTFLQKNILYNILNELYENKPNQIKEKHITDIIQLIKNKKPNISINLPKKKLAIKEYEKLIFKDQDIANNYCIPLQDINYINHIIIKKINNTIEDGNDIARINSNNISLPLYLRNKKDSDYIYLKGTQGRKKIKDIFIEKRIPLRERKTYPILVDSKDNVIWIPNLKKSKFNSLKNEFCDIILKYCEKEEIQ